MGISQASWQVTYPYHVLDRTYRTLRVMLWGASTGRLPAEIQKHFKQALQENIKFGHCLTIDTVYDAQIQRSYFDKKADGYDKKSISSLPKKEYLEFLEAFFTFLKINTKNTTRFAFINADWRDFQGKPAREETGKGAIMIDEYLSILKKTGWHPTHIIQAPMSSQRFSAGVVSAMQKKRILGVTSRYVIVLKQKK